MENATKYFLKLADGTGYEEVDHYTYINKTFALNNKGDGPRYLPDIVVEVEGGLVKRMVLLSVPSYDVAILTRMLGAKTPAESPNSPWGKVPEVIKFKRGNSIKMRYMKEGTNWNMESAKKKTDSDSEPEAA